MDTMGMKQSHFIDLKDLRSLPLVLLVYKQHDTRVGYITLWIFGSNSTYNTICIMLLCLCAGIFYHNRFSST